MAAPNFAQYVPKRTAVAHMGQLLGGAIAGIPEQRQAEEKAKREKELYGMQKEKLGMEVDTLRAAAEAAKKEPDSLRKSVRAAKELFKEKTDAWVNEGLITSEEQRLAVEGIKMPTATDMKDTQKYMERTRTVLSNAYKNFEEKTRRAGIGKTVTKYTEGQEGIATKMQPIQSRPVKMEGRESGQLPELQHRPTAIAEPGQQAITPTQDPGEIAAGVKKEMGDVTATELKEDPQYSQLQEKAKETKEAQLTPYQKWTKEYKMRKDSANTRLKEEEKKIKKGEQTLKGALELQRDYYGTLNDEAGTKIDEMKKDLQMDKELDIELPTSEENRLKNEIKRLEGEIKENNKIINSSALESIKHLPPGDYRFEGGVPIRQGGAGGGGAGGGEPNNIQDARSAIAWARDLIKEGDFKEANKGQLDKIIQNAQTTITNAGF